MDSNEQRGTIALVLGIASFAGGGVVLAIPAWILGAQVVNEYRRDHPQHGLANIGRILGMVNVVVTVALLAIAVQITAFTMLRGGGW